MLVCSFCHRCKECTFRCNNLSEKEREVVKKIEESMLFVNGHIMASYPWKPCIFQRTSNHCQVKSGQGAMETSMIKARTLEGFVEEIENTLW